MSDAPNASPGSHAKPILKGSCFCGNVSFAISAPPILSAYCHCTNCQRLNACPFIHTMHFAASAFTWMHDDTPELCLDSFVLPEKPHKQRWRCKTCGSCVASYNKNTDRWSVWGCQLERNEDGTIKDWDIAKPTVHMFYGTRVLDISDGLGKWEGYENQSAKLS
ncbi:hypothetical protein PILCRDRAFT_813756 [Piloderma croceum F 1598]|uniref:CENP-V/GFA domain-containing protein n=1 Tax=Piloderma croceum (strain F 1598) TaxID=765440 RepID=A0A0C3FX29_PILCF|nr:hypothetical protein PILCRDRAFT_813756 [Piloderma croceum F 1598]